MPTQKVEEGDSVLVRGEVTHLIEGERYVRVIFPGSEYPTVVSLNAIEGVTKAKRAPRRKVMYDKPD